jgi:hypothetical protein
MGAALELVWEAVDGLMAVATQRTSVARPMYIEGLRHFMILMTTVHDYVSEEEERERGIRVGGLSTKVRHLS